MTTNQIRKSILASILLLGLGPNAHSSDSAWVEQRLAEFNKDPKSFIFDSRNVSKYDPSTLQPLTDQSKFSIDSVKSGGYLQTKQSARKQLLNAGNATDFAEFKENDLAQDLVDELKYKTLQEMDVAQLRSAKLESQAWSGSYWPMYMGGMAFRYADPGFPFSEDWKDNTDYLQKISSPVGKLSPAEKYDLLVGDTSKTFTSHMIGQGKTYYERDKKVESWIGYCHGWSPASFMLPRPARVIKVLAADGKTEIPFYPDDIKALATALWANGTTSTRSISSRCDVRKPRDDRGHILAQECFDTNPGTWHMSVVNQMGHSKRPLIFDSAYDYEVWTQPAQSYKYSYFNPQTGKAVARLDDAIVTKEQFTNDKFAKYRSSKTKYIVGVSFDLVYMNETNPTHRETDSPSQDQKVGVTYLYDIEMDQDKNIVGGEWYQLQHPDFLFVTEKDSKASTVGDHYLYWRNGGTWDGKTPVSKIWTESAVLGSKKGQPLAGIVEKLIDLSNGT